MTRIILTEAEAQSALTALTSATDSLSRIAEKTGPPYRAEMDKRIQEFNELANIINARLEQSRRQP